MIDAFSASAWIFYGLAIGAILIMRITHEDVQRKFEVRQFMECHDLCYIIHQFCTYIIYYTKHPFLIITAFNLGDIEIHLLAIIYINNMTL